MGIIDYKIGLVKSAIWFLLGTFYLSLILSMCCFFFDMSLGCKSVYLIPTNIPIALDLNLDD